MLFIVKIVYTKVLLSAQFAISKIKPLCLYVMTHISIVLKERKQMTLSEYDKDMSLYAYLDDLETENKSLRENLAHVTAERDAAIKDLNEILSMDELCPIQCEWCRWDKMDCDEKTPEWRGMKKEG